MCIQYRGRSILGKLCFAFVTAFFTVGEAQDSAADKWQEKSEVYWEDRVYGHQIYKSNTMYVSYEPRSENYQAYFYNEALGQQDYHWKNYDNGVYTEKQFREGSGELTYYATQDGSFNNWLQQVSFMFIFALSTCVVVSICFCFAIAVSQRMRKIEQQEEMERLQEIEGIDMNDGELGGSQADFDDS